MDIADPASSTLGGGDRANAETLFSLKSHRTLRQKERTHGLLGLRFHFRILGLGGYWWLQVGLNRFNEAEDSIDYEL